MSEFHTPDTSNWAGAVVVSDLGIILAQGDDAATFLHGQVSQDIANQTAAQSKLGAYCSPKGRMLGSFVSLRPAPDTVHLLVDASLVASLVKRLSMFVLRAKAKISDASEQLRAVGIIGAQLISQIGGDAAQPVGSSQTVAGGQLARLSDAQGQPRWIWVGEASVAADLLTKLPPLHLDQWRWLDVMAGIARIAQATSDQFVPQMINYELVGGVNFQKGCYPGQEVVARSQYRGTTKRRAFVIHAAAALAPGQEIYSQQDPGQPAGVVVNAAPVPGSDSDFSAIAELKLALVDTALHLGSIEGPAITLGQLPYALPGDDDRSA